MDSETQSATSTRPPTPHGLSLGDLGARFLQEALGYGIGGAISPAIAPLTQDLANEAWSQLQTMPLSPAELAAIVVNGYLTQAEAGKEAALSGINATRFDLLVKQSGQPIAPDQALDLWNRGQISEAQVDHALQQGNLKDEWIDDFKKLRVQLLQIADLANMVVQSILPEPEAAKRAAQLGLDPADFARLVRLAGNPPGPETILEMWNRGYIDESKATLGLLQSRLKPEWVDDFKKTRIRPATIGEAVTAVVKERITEARGEQIAAQNGMDAQTFKMLVDEAGRPIAIGQALTLYRRGEMTKAEVQEVIARSDVKTEYTAHILQLATVYPSLFQLKQMIATGALADAEAVHILKLEGYTDEVIKAVVAAGHGIKLAGSKQLTQAAVLDLYKAGELPRAQAEQMLTTLGYDKADADLELGLADYQAAKTYRDAVISVVRARFLQSDIDATQAGQLLDQVGLPAAARDRYLQLWEFDVQANPRLLTLAELNQLVKKQLWTTAEYVAYLPRLNYQQPEIEALVQLYASG